MQMNISQLAELFEMDRATVRKRLRSAGVSPVANHRGVNLYSTAEACAAIFAPKGIPTTDPDLMAPTDRKAWYESESKRRALQERDRELYPREDVLHTFTVTIATIADQMRALPDRLEREAGIDGQAAALVESTVDAQLEVLRRELMAVVAD